MAITKKLGTSAVMKAGGTAIPLVTAANFNITNGEVKVTDNDSTGAWDEFLMGNRAATCSFTFHWDSALTGGGTAPQELFATNIAGTNASVAYIYYPGGTSAGQRTYSFNGYVKEVVHNTSNNTVVEVTVTLTVTGAVTVGTA